MRHSHHSAPTVTAYSMGNGKGNNIGNHNNINFAAGMFHSSNKSNKSRPEEEKEVTKKPSDDVKKQKDA